MGVIEGDRYRGKPRAGNPALKCPRTAMARHLWTYSEYGNYKVNILNYFVGSTKEMRSSIWATLVERSEVTRLLGRRGTA